MEYTTLGKTGLKVSRLGFGGLPIQRTERADVVPLIKSAADAGINYIDTAKGYTVSEEFIGLAMETMRDKFILATKSMSRDAAGMAADIDDSLAKLRTDYIDIYQLHNLKPEELDIVKGPGGALEALKAAAAAGKIGHIGVTTHSVETFGMLLEEPWAETVMLPYNLVETQGAECIAKAREKNIGFLAMKPLAGGALENADLAIRYLLADKNVDIALVGVHSREEVAANAASAEKAGPLSPGDLREIQKIRDEMGSVFCRRCNYCAPCTAGIAIPQVFIFGGYLERYGLGDWAKSRYFAMDKRAKDCVGCGECEKRCPYGLPIRQMMKKYAKMFGEE